MQLRKHCVLPFYLTAVNKNCQTYQNLHLVETGQLSHVPERLQEIMEEVGGHSDQVMVGPVLFIVEVEEDHHSVRTGVTLHQLRREKNKYMAYFECLQDVSRFQLHHIAVLFAIGSRYFRFTSWASLSQQASLAFFPVVPFFCAHLYSPVVSDPWLSTSPPAWSSS